MYEGIHDVSKGLENRSEAHVLVERVDPKTRLKYLHVKFAEGKVEEVCARAIIRPSERRCYRATPVDANASPVDAVDDLHMPPFLRVDEEHEPPYDGHPSSADDFFSSSDAEHSQCLSSSATNTNDELRHAAIGTREAAFRGDRSGLRHDCLRGRIPTTPA